MLFAKWDITNVNGFWWFQTFLDSSGILVQFFTVVTVYTHNIIHIPRSSLSVLPPTNIIHPPCLHLLSPIWFTRTQQEWLPYFPLITRFLPNVPFPHVFITTLIFSSASKSTLPSVRMMAALGKYLRFLRCTQGLHFMNLKHFPLPVGAAVVLRCTHIFRWTSQLCKVNAFFFYFLRNINVIWIK